jgi:hypothetical protein
MKPSAGPEVRASEISGQWSVISDQWSVTWSGIRAARPAA